MGKKKKSFRCKIGVWFMMLLLVLQMGCGTGENPSGQDVANRDKAQSTEQSKGTELQILEKSDVYAYVAKEPALADGSWWVFMEAKFSPDMMVYLSGNELVGNTLAGSGVERTAFVREDGELKGYGLEFCLGEDGSIYTYVQVVKDGKAVYYLRKFTEAGQFVYETECADFAESMGEVYESQWKMEADSEGRICLASDTKAGLFDGEGNYLGQLTLDNPTISINGVARGLDGVLYVTYRNAATGTSYIGALDFNEKKIVNAATTSLRVTGLSKGMEKALLVYTENDVYEYDVTTGSLTPLFSWGDCNVNGQEITVVDVLADGRVGVITASTSYGDATLITRMTQEEAAAKTVERKEVTLATLNHSLSKDLSEAVVRFNKENEKYKIVVKNYSATGEGYAQASDRLLAEIATGNGPDMYDITSGLDVESLAEKGLFEDLNTYLEQSENYSAEDFVDRLLEIGTYDGKLVGIPHAFTMYTYMGSREIVGEEMGWTLEDMLEVIKANPDKELLYGKTRGTMLNLFLQFNESLFIDWETGKCNFNSPEFMALLEITNSFPAENNDVGWGKPSLATKVSNREVILADIYMSGFFALQPYCDIFTQGYTCVGYPSAEGIGVRAQLYDMLAISSQSKVKEGAWEFLEYFYKYRRDTGKNIQSFPCLKSQMEQYANDSMTMEERWFSHHTLTDGVEYTNRHLTQEEVDLIYKLVDGLQVGDMDSEVFNIIKEEAADYFDGQKSVEAVAEIIQNRVQNYVDELK